MKKFKFYLLIPFFIFCILSLKAPAYEQFGGKYTYNGYNSANTADYSSVASSDKEILFIVDYSSSMNLPLDENNIRVNVAIESISEILSTMPDDANIGLRLFGLLKVQLREIKTESQYLELKRQACMSTENVVPISPYSHEKIMYKLKSYTPLGVTPIGYSLRQAIEYDFSFYAPFKHIILVTDGGENCGDDPCQYIKELMRTRHDIKIDVIGITIDSNIYSQMNCIANSTGGKFYNVSNKREFKEKVHEAVYASDPRPNINSSYSIKKPTSVKHSSGVIYKNILFEVRN